MGVTGDSRGSVEELLRRTYGADECVLCDSGTHALQMAMGVARRLVGEGSRIAVPAFSCYDVATAAIAVGGDVCLYDIDPMTLSPDADSLERVLNEGARVVVIAPLYGMPVDWDAAEALAAQFGAILIEDAAQGHGGSWKGRRLGSLGRLTCLSFGRGKGWTSGGGGALLLRQIGGGVPSLGESAPRAELSTTIGLLAQAVLGRPAIYGLPNAMPSLHLGETTYVEPTTPRAMTRAAAAALSATEQVSMVEAAVRVQNAELLRNALEGVAHVRQFAPIGGGASGYLRFPLAMERGMARFTDAHQALRLGIAGSYPTTLAELPVLGSKLANGGEAFSGAKRLARDLITLPTHSLVKDSERAKIAALLRNCIKTAV